MEYAEEPGVDVSMTVTTKPSTETGKIRGGGLRFHSLYGIDMSLSPFRAPLIIAFSLLSHPAAHLACSTSVYHLCSGFTSSTLRSQGSTSP